MSAKPERRFDAQSKVSRINSERSEQHQRTQPEITDLNAFRRRAHFRYSEFLIKQMAVSIAFVFSVDDLTKAVYEEDNVFPVGRVGRGRYLAQRLGEHVVAIQQPVAIDDVHSHPLIKYDDALLDTRVGAFLGAPIGDAEKGYLGLVCVMDRKMRAWKEVERSFLVTVALEIEIGWRSIAREV